MTVSLYNTLTKTTEQLHPIKPSTVQIYSCGPTVYDHVHIGNLSAFITADVLRRAIQADGNTVTHVMNFTDVDDKTIRRSHERYPGLEPMQALKQLTVEYSGQFLEDMQKIGNDVDALTFLRAADDDTIQGMRDVITELYTQGFAYIADDGVYFSIEAYKTSGKTYGQLVELTKANTGNQRIQNDEYDKESVHDFALWKTQKPGEPAWELTIDGNDLTGRPGWHLECSVMSRMGVGQPFDIHTGGIDLAFPHHENEIAQSTAGHDDPTYAQLFVHNEHVLVDGKKMSKSLGNFYTLADLTAKNVDPLAFRLLVLQSHYRKPTNFSLKNATAAHNRLQHWRNIAALRWQTHDDIAPSDSMDPSPAAIGAVREALLRDLNTPEALRIIDETFTYIESHRLNAVNQRTLTEFLEAIDTMLGLQLLDTTPDISEDHKKLILERQRAREAKGWARSDELRDQLASQGLIVRDTADGPVWEYISTNIVIDVT
ncbi:MAG: cysteine--tRNA ligase [Candidatus Saccharimonadales bacterium]